MEKLNVELVSGFGRRMDGDFGVGPGLGMAEYQPVDGGLGMAERGIDGEPVAGFESEGAQLLCFLLHQRLFVRRHSRCLKRSHAVASSPAHGAHLAVGGNVHGSGDNDHQKYSENDVLHHGYSFPCPSAMKAPH